MHSNICIDIYPLVFRVVSFADQIISDNNANLNVCPIGSMLPTVASSNTTGLDLTRGTTVTTPSTTTWAQSGRTCALPRVAGTGQQLAEDVGAQQFGITEDSRLEYPALDPNSFKRK